MANNFVLDKSGRIRWTHVGEGRYDETEQVIQKLLAEDVRASNGKASWAKAQGTQVTTKL